MDFTADYYVLDKTLAAGEGHGVEVHDAAIWTLVVNGRLDETSDRVHQLCPRWRLHYKPAHWPHETSTGPQGTRMLIVGVRGRLASEIDLPEAPFVVGSGVEGARSLGSFLDLVDRRRRPPERERRRVREVFADLVARTRPTAHRPEAGGDTAPPSWLTEVDERVRAQRPGASLSPLAADFGVHPVYLARAYRRHYGASIGQVRRRLRVDRAVPRVAAGRVPLVELAADLGYADQSHFSREFKRETGWSPGAFRRTATPFRRPGCG